MGRIRDAEAPAAGAEAIGPRERVLGTPLPRRELDFVNRFIHDSEIWVTVGGGAQLGRLGRLGGVLRFGLGILICSRCVRTWSCGRVSGSRAGEVGAVRGRGRKIWREDGRGRVQKKRAQLEKFGGGGGGISPSVRQRAGDGGQGESARGRSRKRGRSMAGSGERARRRRSAGE